MLSYFWRRLYICIGCLLYYTIFTLLSCCIQAKNIHCLALQCSALYCSTVATCIVQALHCLIAIVYKLYTTQPLVVRASYVIVTLIRMQPSHCTDATVTPVWMQPSHPGGCPLTPVWMQPPHPGWCNRHTCADATVTPVRMQPSHRADAAVCMREKRVHTNIMKM